MYIYSFIYTYVNRSQRLARAGELVAWRITVTTSIVTITWLLFTVSSINTTISY